MSDNGRGINPAELVQARTFGLVGMRERVRMLSGQLDIEGRPGQGITVTVRVPLSTPNGDGGFAAPAER